MPPSEQAVASFITQGQGVFNWGRGKIKKTPSQIELFPERKEDKKWQSLL